MGGITNESHALQLLRAGDIRALESIWQLYADDLLAYLTALLHSRQDAEDVLQEVFIEIAKRHQRVGAAKELKPYLFRMSRNVAFNLHKKSKRRAVREKGFSLLMQTQEEGDRDDGHSELQLKLEKALRLLPEKQRAVLSLKFYRKKTFREIAEMLDISENTASSRYRYGMLKIKQKINGGS